MMAFNFLKKIKSGNRDGTRSECIGDNATAKLQTPQKPQRCNRRRSSKTKISGSEDHTYPSSVRSVGDGSKRSGTYTSSGQSTGDGSTSTSRRSVTFAPQRLRTNNNQATAVDEKRAQYMGRLASCIRVSLLSLSPLSRQNHISEELIHSISTFIYEGMTNSGKRVYHSISHVFDVLDPSSNDCTLDLAALFYDVVYYAIDGKLSPGQAYLLKDVIELQTDTELVISPKILANDQIITVVTAVFGYKAGSGDDGQIIRPFDGSNEFLSALCAAQLLRDVLDITQIAQIAACIEATIPFRQTNDHGSPMERLYDRLCQVSKDYDLEMSEFECETSVKRAAMLAYWDLLNFSSSNPAHFLDNTWALLPETHPTLREVYTVKEYQYAMFKMYGFFGFLNPNVVFVKFRGVPTNYVHVSQGAERNLSVGKDYIGAKLLSASVIVALAELTGGDGPILSFFNSEELLRENKDGKQNLSWLPSPVSNDKYDFLVHRVLSKGRKKGLWFDVWQSHLAAYLYCALGEQKIRQLNENHCKYMYPMSEAQSKILLDQLPRDVVGLIIECMASEHVPRSEQLNDLLKEYRT